MEPLGSLDWKRASGASHGYPAISFHTPCAEAAHKAALDARDDADRLSQPARIVGRALLQRTLDIDPYRHRRAAGDRQRSGADPARSGRQREKLPHGARAPEDPAPDIA